MAPETRTYTTGPSRSFRSRTEHPDVHPSDAETGAHRGEGAYSADQISVSGWKFTQEK